MSKTDIEKFVNETLKEIKGGLTKGFRIDDKVHFDIALVTNAKIKGKLDIKLVSIGSNLESQIVHRIKFSVIDEESQKKSQTLGKQMINDLMTTLQQLDSSQVIKYKPQNKKSK